MRNHGTDPRTRVALQRERILAMKEIWTHPPLWLGGWGPSTHERILDHADGWLAPTGIPIDELGRGIEQLRELTRRRDRPPVPVIATVFDLGPGDLDRLADLGVHRTLIGPAVSPREDALRLLDQAAQQVSPSLTDR